MAHSVENKPKKTTPLGGHWSDKMIAEDRDGYQLVQQHRTELESALRKIKKSAKSSSVDVASEVKKLRQNAEKKLQDAMLVYTAARDNGDTASSSSGRDKSVQKQIEEGINAALKPYTGMLSALAQQPQQQMPPRTPLALEDADRVMKRARKEAAKTLVEAPSQEVQEMAAKIIAQKYEEGTFNRTDALEAAIVRHLPSSTKARVVKQHLDEDGKVSRKVAKLTAHYYVHQVESLPELPINASMRDIIAKETRQRIYCKHLDSIKEEVAEKMAEEQSCNESASASETASDASGTEIKSDTDETDLEIESASE